MNGPEALKLMQTMHARETVKRSQNYSPEIQALITAAQNVAGLSGWRKLGDGREVYQTSYMAVEVLRNAIAAAENPPLLQLAPEPLPAGIGGSAT